MQYQLYNMRNAVLLKEHFHKNRLHSFKCCVTYKRYAYLKQLCLSSSVFNATATVLCIQVAPKITKLAFQLLCLIVPTKVKEHTHSETCVKLTVSMVLKPQDLSKYLRINIHHVLGTRTSSVIGENKIRRLTVYLFGYNLKRLTNITERTKHIMPYLTQFVYSFYVLHV